MTPDQLDILASLYIHTPNDERRKVEKHFGLSTGAVALHMINRADRARVAALASGQLKTAELNELGMLAACNASVAPEVTELVAGVEALGVDAKPFHEALASLSKPLVPALMASTALTQPQRPAVDWLTISAGDAFDPIHLPKRMMPGLSRGALTLLASAPEVGKSALACAIAVAVATGCKEILGFKPEWCGAVWYLIAEDSRDTIRARIQAILRHHKLTTKDLQYPIHLIGGGDGGPLTLFGRAERNGIPVVTPVGSALDREAHAKKPALLIVDTFAAAFASLDENSASDTSAALGWLGRLAIGADAAVLLLHHLNKGADGQAHAQVAVRGSSALTASVRAVYGLSAVRDPARAGVPVGTLKLDLIKANNEKTGPVGCFEKSGVKIPAIDPRDTTAITALSTVVLTPVQPTVPSYPTDALASIDVPAMITALRAGFEGNAALPWVPDKRSPHAVHGMLRDIFGINKPEVVDQVVQSLVDRGLIAFEERPRKNGKTREVIIVQPDAENRAAPVQPPEGALSGDVNVFD